MELIGAQYFLNHHLQESELRQQIGQLAEAGYQVIYGHARAGLETPYFSQAWWNAIEIIIDECHKHGLKFAIWDEDYYPSGIAGNRIMWEHPELTAQKLHFTVTPCAASEHFCGVYREPGTILKAFAVEADGEIRDISSYSGSTRRDWDLRRRQTTSYSPVGKLPTPHWRATMEPKAYGVEWQAPNYGKWQIVTVQVVRTPGRHNTDLLNPATTEHFIELTHEEYFQRFKVHFDRVHSSFMDEPAPDGEFPWTTNFPDAFEEKFHRNLLDLLPHLVLNINQETPFIRLAYREIQRDLLCRNYLDKVGEWDHQHGILSIGHLTRAEYLSLCNISWPNELACYAHLDVPCCDPLGFHIAIPEARAYHTAIKVVASAERHFKKCHSGSDALAVMGNEATLDDLRYALEFHLALGVTFFNIHGLDYSIDGTRKDETPPSLFYQHSQWPLMPDLLREVRRYAEKLSEGEVVRQIAVLYPSETFLAQFDGTPLQKEKLQVLEDAFHELSEQLIFSQRDYDFVDEANIQNLPLADCYQVIVLYRLKYLHRETANCLKKFPGKVLIIGEIPQLVEENLAPLPLGKFIYAPELTAEVLNELPRENLTGDQLDAICLKHLKQNNQDCYYLFNRSRTPFHGTLNGQAVHVPPRRGILQGEAAPVAVATSPIAAITQWQVEFPFNSLPLNQWRCQFPDGSTREFDFMTRLQLPSVTENVTCYCLDFCVSGSAQPHLKLVLEESSFAGSDYQIFLNDQQLPTALPDPVRDCRNRSIDLNSQIKTGVYPTLNHLVIKTNSGTTLQEMPYIYGQFVLTYPHGHGVMGYLELRDDLRFKTAFPLDWNNWGFPAYSGSATYRANFLAPAAGRYIFTCDRLANAGRVRIDGKVAGVALTAPYEVNLGKLQAGEHKLEIEVFNNPANAVRLGGHPSGILSAVKIKKIL